MDIEVKEEVEIGSFTYRIIANKENDFDLRADSLSGDHSFLKKEIRVITDIGEDHFNNSFLHEVGHAIDRMYLGGSLEENEIAGMANGYHQLFKQLGINFVVSRKELKEV